ncbi:MAG: hypothetical protein ACLUKN_01385 [Bacilli bacterium]
MAKTSRSIAFNALYDLRSTSLQTERVVLYFSPKNFDKFARVVLSDVRNPRPAGGL